AVTAQVQHQGLHAVRLQAEDGVLQLLHRVLVEAQDADVADALARHGVVRNAVADERLALDTHGPRGFLAALHLEVNETARGALQPGLGDAGGKALGCLAVDADDLFADLEDLGRGAFRVDVPDDQIPRLDLDANADEPAALRLAHLRRRQV